MLDLDHLRRIHPRKKPPGQVVFAEGVLRWDYKKPRRTHIVIEGLERVPRDRSVVFAMNHTDRYNCWPFQYELYRLRYPFTATWVKAKYYENPWMARFMDLMNNIPLPSRGFVLTTEFRRVHGRVPNEGEYRALRSLVDGTAARDGSDAAQPLPPSISHLVRKHGGSPAALGASLQALFSAMMREVKRISEEAVTIPLHLVIFPQGTRSKRLIKGLTGLAQISQHLGVPILPVGCSGSDRLYPGSSPFSRGGRVVYRVGRLLEPDGPELGRYRVRDRFEPFTDEAAAAHRPQFEAITEIVMNDINGLVDADYQFGGTQAPGDERGARRFV